MSKAGRLGLVLLLNLLLVAALVIVGAAAHSLGVLAAGVDYLADAAAIGVSLLAIWLTNRPTRHRLRRWDPTDIAALGNAGWLLVLNVGVVVAAVRRLVFGTRQVHGPTPRPPAALPSPEPSFWRLVAGTGLTPQWPSPSQS